MNEVLKLFLSLSVSGSILALGLLAIKPLIKNKLSKCWQYYIWIVVILRLLVPFTPEVSVVGSFFAYLENAAAASTAVVEQERLPAQIDRNLDMQTALPDVESSGPEIVLPDYWADIKSSIWLLWLGVAALLFVRKVTSYYSFVRYVHAGTRRIENERFLAVYKEVSTEAGLKKPLPIYVNQLVASPMLVGIFRPIIIIPELVIDDAELRYVFWHELTHYRRFDIIYKWLVQITVCLHWFNPLIYIISREINRECELYCDEAIISSLDENGRLRYGDTLLSTLKTDGTYRDAIVSLTLSENAELLKERLTAILNFKKRSRVIVFLSIVLAVTFLCGAAFAGAYAKDSIVNTNDNPLNQNVPQNQIGVNSDTAKADHFTPVERPNADITIDNKAAVKLVPTSAKEMSVDYDNTLYQVSVENENGNWKIHIVYTADYSVYPSVVVHVPDVIYGNVNLQIKEATAYFNGVFQSAESINANMAGSSIFYTIPAGFTGTLNADAPDCYFELISKDGYRNCDITITNAAAYGNIEDGFRKHGSSLVYASGTQTGVVKIDLKNGGYAEITSDYTNPVTSFLNVDVDEVNVDEEVSINGFLAVGEDYTSSFYLFNMKAGQVFHITYDYGWEEYEDRGDFEVSLQDESNHRITAQKELNTANDTVDITVPADGRYRLNFRGVKANNQDGEVQYHFTLSFSNSVGN